jgi:hypothetical protein
MRRDRSGRQWSASAAGAALLFILSGSAVTLSASPEPTSSESGSPSASATDAPSATHSPSASPTASAAIPSDPASPTPSAEPACPAPFVIEDSNDVVPGGSVALNIDGFSPNTAVTVNLLLEDGGLREIGTGTTDALGNGVVIGVIPPETPFGFAEVQVIASDGCSASVPLDIVGSLPSIGIGDDTLRPGQLVTMTASGFASGDDVAIVLDGDPGDALCRCRFIGNARAGVDGSVVARARIPRDVPPGAHFLVLSGYSFDGEHDLALSVEITIVGARGTMPPTDTASGG